MVPLFGALKFSFLSFRDSRSEKKKRTSNRSFCMAWNFNGRDYEKKISAGSISHEFRNVIHTCVKVCEIRATCAAYEWKKRESFARVCGVQVCAKCTRRSRSSHTQRVVNSLSRCAGGEIFLLLSSLLALLLFSSLFLSLFPSPARCFSRARARFTAQDSVEHEHKHDTRIKRT